MTDTQRLTRRSFPSRSKQLDTKTVSRGLEFARARVDMKAADTIIHLRREMPAKIKNMVTTHVWHLVKPYGMSPTKAEEPLQRNTDAINK